MQNQPVGRILVVDDCVTVCGAMQLLLEKNGYRVQLATSGAAAIDKAARAEGTLDLVILDMCMFGLDGEATLARMRAFDPQLPCLIYSAYPEDDATARMRATGRCAYLAKPVSLYELLEHIERMLTIYPRARAGAAVTVSSPRPAAVPGRKTRAKPPRTCRTPLKHKR